MLLFKNEVISFLIKKSLFVSEFIEDSHLDDLGVEEAVFVKPLKINPDDETVQYDQSKFYIKLIN